MFLPLFPNVPNGGSENAAVSAETLDPTADPTRTDPRTRVAPRLCTACGQGHLIVIERRWPGRRVSTIPDTS